MSLGKPEFPTMSGKHIVLGKQQKVVMDSRTNGIPLDSSEGYLEDVFWDIQISSTGEYVHAAPWSVDDQGRANVSHGCINLSDRERRVVLQLEPAGRHRRGHRHVPAAEQRHRDRRLEGPVRGVGARQRAVRPAPAAPAPSASSRS